VQRWSNSQIGSWREVKVRNIVEVAYKDMLLSLHLTAVA